MFKSLSPFHFTLVLCIVFYVSCQKTSNMPNVSLIYPTNQQNSVVIQPIFKWETYTNQQWGGVAYRLYLDKTTQPKTIVANNLLTNTDTLRNIILAGDSVYYWKIIAYNTNGKDSISYPTFSFITRKNYSLTTGRTGIAASNIGNSVLFAGGYSSNAGTTIPSYTVGVFTYANNTLSQKASFYLLAGARYGIVSGAIGSKIFLAGGLGSNLSTNAIDVFDFANGSIGGWDNPLYLPQGYTSFAAGTTTGDLFAIGGGINNILNSYYDSISIYNASTRTWLSPQIPLGEQVANLTATSVNGKIIFAGGQNTNGATNNVAIYDTLNNTVTYTLLRQGARYYLASASTNNSAFFAGGTYDGVNSIQNIDIYNSSTGVWSYSYLPSGGRFNLSGATINGEVLFGGGQINISTISDAVDIYDAINNRWLPSTTLPGGPRTNMAASPIGNNFVLFVGGLKSDGTYSNQIDIYNTSTNTWQ